MSEKANFKKILLFLESSDKILSPDLAIHIPFPTMEYSYEEGGNKLLISWKRLTFGNEYSRRMAFSESRKYALMQNRKC